MPNNTYDTRDDIPEGWDKYAKETEDGKFTVSVTPVDKLNEFRDNNNELRNLRDSNETTIANLRKIVGEDTDEFVAELSELRNLKQQVEDGKIKGNEEIQKQVDARVAAVAEEKDAQINAALEKIKALSTERDGLIVEKKSKIIDDKVREAVADENLGVNPQAVTDVIAHARQTFVVDDNNQVVAKDGDQIIYGPEGEPLTVKQWIPKLLEQAPYFSMQSSGGGAGGNDGQGGSGGKLSEKQKAEMSGSELLSAVRQGRA